MLTTLTGKEGNRLLERATGVISDPADYRTTYSHPDSDRWRRLVLPVLQDIHDAVGTHHIAQRVGVSDRQVGNWLAGRDEPHAGRSRNRQRADHVAVEWATEGLRTEGRRVPADAYAVLYAYLLGLGT